jgi:hypothetical protein
MSSWSRVGKPSWRMCAGIAPSLHCTVRLPPSGPLSAGLCWIKPSSGSVWRSPSSKPISTPAAAGMMVRDRQLRDTPSRDGKPPVGAKRICARRQDGRVRRLWPHKPLHATKATGRHPDRSAKGVHQGFTQGLVPRVGPRRRAHQSGSRAQPRRRDRNGLRGRPAEPLNCPVVRRRRNPDATSRADLVEVRFELHFVTGKVRRLERASARPSDSRSRPGACRSAKSDSASTTPRPTLCCLIHHQSPRFR